MLARLTIAGTRSGSIISAFRYAAAASSIVRSSPSSSREPSMKYFAASAACGSGRDTEGRVRQRAVIGGCRVRNGLRASRLTTFARGVSAALAGDEVELELSLALGDQRRAGSVAAACRDRAPPATCLIVSRSVNVYRAGRAGCRCRSSPHFSR